MTSRDFCYWLQGLFELGKPTQLDSKQLELVQRHLSMVFLHEIDPSAGSPEHQADLQKIHDGLANLEGRTEKLEQGPLPSRPDVLLRC